VVWFAVFREHPLRVDEILAAFDEGQRPGGLTIRYPFDDSLFPPEIVPPTFQWEDTGSESDAWLVTIQFPDDEGRMYFETREPAWTPPTDAWEMIKSRSLENQAKVTVLGVSRARQDAIVSSGAVSIRTSKDEVGAPVFYREVNLPFIEAVKDPTRIRWRFGEISSSEQPPIVLENLPACGNCHSFSADAKTMGMDVDYANDKGSYAMLPVSEEMVLDPTKIITWNDYRKEDGEQTFGLLSQVSPDGKYAVSTVKDESVFVPREDLTISQLFFPVKGILAVYCRETGTFRALPGADDPQYVQSNPTWSPDGKFIVFARSKAYHLKRSGERKSVLLSPEDCNEFLNEGKTFQFDVYRIPFNGGNGGKPEPLAGASQNGMSNYFPRYSPDGKWIVFCKAKTFMLLQPDSELYIIPAAGGEARRLRGNTSRMNSWHSWSPNGKWLVFSSKAFTPYTQLFLTHIDSSGQSSPPVLLSHFTSPDRAANIPEFVNARPKAIKHIRERFLNDHSYARLAQTNILAGDVDGAERASRKALELNPKSPDGLCNLGIVLWARGKAAEAQRCFTEAIRIDPKQYNTHVNLGGLLVEEKKVEEGLEHYREALRLNPDAFEAHLPLGIELAKMGQFGEAAEHLADAVRLRPKNAEAHYHLGLALQRQERFDQALGHYADALKQNPNLVSALLGIAAIRATCKQAALRNGAEAVQLASRACELTQFTNAEAVAVLAMAYGEAGRRAEAVAAAKRAVEIARRSGNEPFAIAIQKQLDQFWEEKGLSRPETR
jgi:tetratricopeptide (TPR) repeat protein